MNSDYNDLSYSVVFTSGSTDNAVRCVEIPILEDNVLEGNQTFTVTLDSSDPGALLGTLSKTITITDNDS